MIPLSYMLRISRMVLSEGASSFAVLFVPAVFHGIVSFRGCFLGIVIDVFHHFPIRVGGGFGIVYTDRHGDLAIVLLNLENVLRIGRAEKPLSFTL